MPVNEVSREEAHTRRNNANNRRVYLTPKPIQRLPSTQQQDQRSSHQHNNLLDIITGSKKIINRFTKRSPTSKDSVDREKIQEISSSSGGEIASSSSSYSRSSDSLQTSSATPEEEVLYRQRRRHGDSTMTVVPQHYDIINAQVGIPRDTDAAQCRISSMTRNDYINDSHQREEEDGIIQNNQPQQQPVRLSTMQQHIEQSQLQNHPHQHEDIYQLKPNEDENWKIDALLLQQRDITFAIEQSIQEQSNQASPHPDIHHNQSQSPSESSHTTRRRTQTPPNERFINDSIERSSLMNDIINHTQERQYDLNVLKEMGLIRSSSTTSYVSNNNKEEEINNNE